MTHSRVTRAILVASNNASKISELRSLLSDVGYEVLSPHGIGLRVDVEETGETFEQNARLKAEAFRRASGLPSLSDDSGLVIDALGGEPGVLSARYAGPDADDSARNALVLRRMSEVPAEGRGARFVSCLALALPGGTDVFEGVIEGQIALEPRGRHGFGYDPIFEYPPLGLTFGEMDPAVKDAVSHRGRAARLLMEYLWSNERDILV